MAQFIPSLTFWWKQRLSAYTQYIPMYDFTGIDSITPFLQIKTFERRNAVSLNVYTLSHGVNQKIVPLFINKKLK